MTFDTGANRFAVGRVVLDSMVLMIESNFAPLVVEAVSIQLYLLGLFFALFRNLLVDESKGGGRSSRGISKQQKCSQTQYDDHSNQQSLHSLCPPYPQVIT